MNAVVRLRPSTPADLDYITRLERDAENRKIIGQWTDAEHLAAMRGEQGRWHSVIERDGAPAGYVIGYDRREASGGGVYLKRILVDDKERGTGKAAVRCFLAETFERLAPAFVWLHVYDWNGRAQAVYRALGFVDYHPTVEVAARLDAAAESPAPQAHRMRIDRQPEFRPEERR